MTPAGYRLSEVEQGQLVTLRQMPGFQILLNLFESQIAQMQIDMINADATNEKEVIAKYHLAKASAMFFQRVVDLMNFEIEKFGNRAMANEVQPDLTEALLRD
jgi:hypothetical protein